MDLLSVMTQARQMQERLRKQMSEMRAEATAGGGMVTVVIDGTKQLQSIRLDPAIVSRDDVEMLQDLILAAVNDAQRKIDEQLERSMSGLMGGMKLPGLF
jgi:DNA-binding YbaB/EbfC family protein